MSKSYVSSNALYKSRTLFAVELHPSTVENVLEGVKEQLNANLLRYVDEFDGVLLSYSNLQILTKKPIIHPYFPFFHLDVRADVLVFKPKPGKPLVGRVNLLGEDYISALVMGVFNVAIPARDVMPELQFLREEAKWIHTKHPKHQIAEHSYIVFKVEEVRDHGGYFQITGSLRDPGTGALDFLYPGLKLPEAPTSALAGDAALGDVFGDTIDAADEHGKGLHTTAVAALGPLAIAAPSGTTQHAANGTVNRDADLHKKTSSKRKRGSGIPDEPKGKRRRKEEADVAKKGGLGIRTDTGSEDVPSAKAAAATPAIRTPAVLAATPGKGAAGGSSDADGHKSKSKSEIKKKEKYRDKVDKHKEKDKGKKKKRMKVEDMDGTEQGVAGASVTPAGAAAAPAHTSHAHANGHATGRANGSTAAKVVLEYQTPVQVPVDGGGKQRDDKNAEKTGKKDKDKGREGKGPSRKDSKVKDSSREDKNKGKKKVRREAGDG